MAKKKKASKQKNRPGKKADVKKRKAAKAKNKITKEVAATPAEETEPSMADVRHDASGEGHEEAAEYDDVEAVDDGSEENFDDDEFDDGPGAA